MVIFHGYFGLFVYSVKEEQMLQTIDLEPIVCNYTQGENACEVLVSKDGKKIYLHTMNSETMYVYDINAYGQAELNMNWEKIYGELPDGAYMLEKQIVLAQGERITLGVTFTIGE